MRLLIDYDASKLTVGIFSISDEKRDVLLRKTMLLRWVIVSKVNEIALNRELFVSPARIIILKRQKRLSDWCEITSL